MTDEVAAVEGDNHRMFAWLDGFGDEYVSGDGVAVDHLICEVVNIESREFCLDGCDDCWIHARVWQ